MNTVIFIPIFRKGHFDVTQEDVAVKLQDHDNRIKSLQKRMDETEEKDKTLTELTTSVKTLAVNMEYMAKEQSKQGERLERLESEPANAHKYYKQTITSTIITAIVGAIVGGLLTLIIH